MSFGIPVRNGLAIGLLSSTTLSSNGGLFPAMALDFLQPFLDSRITFSRGSNATLVDSTGKITYAPANLFQRSEEFDNAAWPKAQATVTANATTAPDGTTTADKLVENTATNSHFVYQAVTVPAVTHAVSFYAKAAERSWCYVCGDNTVVLAYFDLANGTVGSTTGVTSANITSVGNGWYRCTIIRTFIAGERYPGIGVANANNGISYTGDGTSGIFIWGAQLEPVTYQTLPSTYVATTTAAYYGPRFDYDPVTLAAKGLLIEEQRTNLQTYSDQFNAGAWAVANATITVNATTSPDGTVNADKLAENTTAVTDHPVYTTGAVTSAIGTTYTTSIYLKASERNWAAVGIFDGSWLRAFFNLSTGVVGTVAAGVTATIAPTGTGWYRCTVTRTAASTSLNVGIWTASADNTFTFAGTVGSGIYLYGAQFETGAFATSYIPTVASTVTRSADVATMTGTNFSSWYNGSAGTFVTSADVFSVAAGDKYVVTIDGNAGRIHYVSTATMSSFDGTNVVSSGQTTTANSVFNTSVAWSGSTMSVCANGAAVVGGNFDGSWGTTSLHLGGTSGSGTAPMNGHIRQIAYYNTRLPNAQLQALTAPPLVTTLSLSFTNQAYTVGV